MIRFVALVCALVPMGGMAETRSVYLEDNDGTRIQIATVKVDSNGGYELEMRDAAFTDHFLSMRPFKCLEGPGKKLVPRSLSL